jgi:hypothetical protein
MLTLPDGEHRENGDASRRLRFDDLTWLVARRRSGSGALRTTGMTAMLLRGHSGRRFVLVAGITLVVIWAILYVIFIDWRAKYRARAAYGATHVVAALDPLETIVPPDVPPDDWRDAVARTRAMLTMVTGSNLLDRKEMETLRAELDQFAARAAAHPETGPRELAGIWDLVTERGEFLFRDNRASEGARHRRPRLLSRAPAKSRSNAHGGDSSK